VHQASFVSSDCGLQVVIKTNTYCAMGSPTYAVSSMSGTTTIGCRCTTSEHVFAGVVECGWDYDGRYSFSSAAAWIVIPLFIGRAVRSGYNL
jgi:hypothetical protein